MSGWKKYKESLENNGYFKGLIPRSKEYKRLMENAEYYRNSLFSKTMYFFGFVGTFLFGIVST